MLVKFTIDSGLVPVTGQAREVEFRHFLNDLRAYDPNAEDPARSAIRSYLDTNIEFTVARIACLPGSDEWRIDFVPLFSALVAVVNDRQRANEIAYGEARKFLGLLVWNETLWHREEWHFTKYPKRASERLSEEDAEAFTGEDIWVCHYYAIDGHIRANAKLSQAENFRGHGHEQRAAELENAARLLQQHFGRTE